MKIVVSSAIKANHHEVREIVRRGFRGQRAADVEVHVKGSWREHFVPNPYGREWHFKDGSSARGHFSKLQGGFSGYAYGGVPTIAQTGSAARWLVTIKMPARPEELGHRYPDEHQDSRAKSMPKYTLSNWQEELLRVAAHEAYHVTQHKRGLPLSEVECERHAVHVLTGQRCSHPRRGTRRRLSAATEGLAADVAIGLLYSGGTPGEHA